MLEKYIGLLKVAHQYPEVKEFLYKINRRNEQPA